MADIPPTAIDAAASASVSAPSSSAPSSAAPSVAAALSFVPRLSSNVQIARIREHFGSIAAADVPLPEPLRFIFLCFTQRCGSTYLAQLIASGGQHNVPREYLNFEHVISRSAKRNLPSFGDYFADLIRSDAKKGMIFIKITPLHLGLLAQAGLLERVVGRSDFILIERGDKLAQAISFAIARETGKFTSNMQSRKSEADLVYEREPIVRLLKSLIEYYKQFDMFFGMNGIVPVNIVYEQLVADPKASLKLISDRLGLPEFAIRQDRIRNARQASVVNAAWRALFLQGDGQMQSGHGTAAAGETPAAELVATAS